MELIKTAAAAGGDDGLQVPDPQAAGEVVDADHDLLFAEIQGLQGVVHQEAGRAANGVLDARAIAHASSRLIGLALGAEDYVTDLKTTRSDGTELLFPGGRSPPDGESASAAVRPWPIPPLPLCCPPRTAR